MNRNFFFLLLSVTVLCVSSCRYMGGKRVRGNGVSATQEKQMGTFNGISVSGGIDVFVAPGPNSLKIEADQNLLEYIEVENRGNVIEVRERRGYNLKPVSGIKVFASAPSFSTIEVSGSGNIKSQSKITGNSLNVEIRGSGDIQLEVDAPKVATEIAGSGSMRLSGRTQDYSAGIKGSGDVRSFDLLSEHTTVDISGSGNAEVFASKQLDIEIKGAGDVRYKGTATVSQKIMGSGSVKQAN